MSLVFFVISIAIVGLSWFSWHEIGSLLLSHVLAGAAGCSIGYSMILLMEGA